MGPIDRVRQQWNDHGTKYLGAAGGICGVLAASPLLTEKGREIAGLIGGIIGVLTVQRGFENSVRGP